ncbi:Ash-like/host cell division inhibitor Icd-like protein [Shigella boydii]|uniref:Ash-like/host cell division inhibitor Icd-like protein n=2 Tax=Enterobacteriaceae TaxID=543 RepID=A0A8H9AG89_SHIBO|nr:Ash-like/host cell division inhibitor Icd-like protein [Shigella boydii]
MRRSSSHHGADSDYSASLALRRWRRLISPRMAALINCPVLSPSSFTFSMPSIISWAIRAVTDCDFAFFGPVAMSNPSCFWCKTIYTKKNYFEGLTCKILLFYIVSYTLSIQGSESAKPSSAGTLTGLLTTNDRKRIEVAMLNHTTHPQGRDSHNLNKAGVKNQLIATASQGYDLSAPAKSGAGIGVLVFNEAHNTRPACFFVPDSHTLSMVGCMGAEQSAPGSSLTGYANPAQSTASEIGVSCGGFINPNEEAANMATTPTLVHSQTAFIWRFIAFGASEHQIIHVTAWTEREARSRCPSGCVAVFAARIRQGVGHA